MNLISRAAARLGAPRNRTPVRDIQAAPVSWVPAAGHAAVITKVDFAVRIGAHVLVSGWSSAPASLRLVGAGRSLESRRFQVPRPDVARYLGRDDASQLGWVLLVEDAPGQLLRIECLGPSDAPVASFPLQFSEDRLSADARVQLAPALAYLRDRPGAAVEDSRQLAAAMEGDGEATHAFAAGAIDDVRASPNGRHGIASGWLVRLPGVQAWLEDGRGRRFSLDRAHWVHRADVAASVAAALAPFTEATGFLLPLEGVAPGDRLRLVTRCEEDEMSIAESSCIPWGGGAIAASRWLFGYPTPMAELAARVRDIDLPLLEDMIQEQQQRWPALPVRVEQAGSGPAEPVASIVIPLHGRQDFVEHQLLEFARDPWLLRNAEIIYVLDDRRLLDGVAANAHAWHRLHGVPFRWIWGGANRGFSGANNLGAAHARGEFLVFLNSDAFPRSPGWVEGLVAALRDDAGIGAVGPRLLFGGGGIQHAGMRFERRDDLGIWINAHPWLGLAPELDPNEAPTDVPAVTGACLAMRREHFDRVEGWDTGYLVGDFEDSDLCLKLRAAGLRIVYLPGIELTHLERQSFVLLGEGEFRTRVTIYNAVRHETRWREAIEASARETTP